MNARFTKLALGVALGSFFSGTLLASDLVVTFDDLNTDKKAAYEAVIEAFKEANPDINVTANNGDREAHKNTIRNALQNDAPDVITWYPGNRMGPLVDAGLFLDISDLWASDPNLSEKFNAIKPTMSRDDKQWGVPYSYYQWGIYYRKDIYDKLGLSEPATWDELLGNCDKLTEVGVTPFTVGSQNLWPLAGIFDYLNLRTNGYEVHNDLTAGKIKYTDERIRATFANWAEMLERCPFVSTHATMDWQAGITPFANGDAAHYVMGNFSVGQYKDAGLSDEQIDFFQFPEITPGVPRAEEAPADAFFIPAKATNVENAKKFMAFIATPEVQGDWNKAIGQLPPNSDAPINTDDKFIVEGMETLSTASGLAQFFDRDAPAAMADAAMQGFQKFMLDPSSLDEILENLDKVQAEVYQ